MSLVLVAASFRSCAPMFSYGSWSSTTLATVTPSCVTVGAPNCLSRATLRPLGPSVVETASASLSTPRLRLRRASSENRSCLAICLFLTGWFSRVISHLRCAGHDGKNVCLFENQHLLAIDLGFGAGIPGVEHLVVHLDIHRDELALIVATTRANGHDCSLLRLFLGCLGQQDATRGNILTFAWFDDNAVAQRT